MSMTVNKADYISSMIQNPQRSSSKELNQAEGMETAKTTQQGTAAASLDQVHLSKDGITVNQVSCQLETEQTSARSAAPRMDRVEISSEGQAAYAKLQKQKLESDSESDSASTVEDLSQYTNAELKQMYRKGEITRQQYEKQTGETLE